MQYIYTDNRIIVERHSTCKAGLFVLWIYFYIHRLLNSTVHVPVAFIKKNQIADCTETKKKGASKKVPKLEKNSCDLGGDWDVVNSQRRYDTLT